jgi:hypothetical protein
MIQIPENPQLFVFNNNNNMFVPAANTNEDATYYFYDQGSQNYYEYTFPSEQESESYNSYSFGGPGNANDLYVYYAPTQSF